MARRSEETIPAHAAAARNTRSAVAPRSKSDKGDEYMRAELEQPIELLSERIDEMRTYL